MIALIRSYSTLVGYGRGGLVERLRLPAIFLASMESHWSWLSPLKKNQTHTHCRCQEFDFKHSWVVVSNIFYFHPYLGKIPILTNIFQLGWFNHQPASELHRSVSARDFSKTPPRTRRLFQHVKVSGSFWQFAISGCGEQCQHVAKAEGGAF